MAALADAGCRRQEYQPEIATLQRRDVRQGKTMDNQESSDSLQGKAGEYLNANPNNWVITKEVIAASVDDSEVEHVHAHEETILSVPNLNHKVVHLIVTDAMNSKDFATVTFIRRSDSGATVQLVLVNSNNGHPGGLNSKFLDVVAQDFSELAQFAKTIER